MYYFRLQDIDVYEPGDFIVYSGQLALVVSCNVKTGPVSYKPTRR